MASFMIQMKVTQARKGRPPILICDLHGTYPDDFVVHLPAAMTKAERSQCAEIRFVHGVGTGALRSRVIEELEYRGYAINTMDIAITVLKLKT